MRRLEDLYYSENTKRTRSVQIRRYENFCKDHHFVCFPLSSMVMRKYVAFLSKEIAYASIQQYVSAILVHARMLGFKDESRQSLGLLWILGGVKRWKGNFVESSTCIFPEHLLNIKSKLDLRVMEDVVFWTACLIMFRTLLRGSNVLESEMVIGFEDVVVYDWGVVFNVKRTKTIQFKERVLQIPVANVKGHPLCFMNCLRLIREYSGTGPGKPLLGWSKNGVFRPANYKWFVKRLSTVCDKLGMKGKFGTHSFRHGGATTLSMVGMDLKDISKKGDWKSICVLRYLNRPLANLVVEERMWSRKVLEFVI